MPFRPDTGRLERAGHLFHPTAGALLLLVLVLLGVGCGKEHASHSASSANLPAVTVRVQTVDSNTHVATEEVVGTVRAKLRAVLAAKVSGRIEKLLAVLGQAVKAGEPLVQLDAREIQARLDQALAQHDQAERDLQRFTTLRFEADVPETLLRRVRPGAKLVVRIPAVEQELTGTVSEISAAADPESRTVLVKLELPPTAGLRTGQFGRVAVPLAERTALPVLFFMAYDKPEPRPVGRTAPEDRT